MKITTISTAFTLSFFVILATQTPALAATTDVVAPTVGITSPTSGTPGVSTTFSASYSDNVGVTSCYLSIGGHAGVAATLRGGSSGTATASYTLAQDTDGETTAYFYCLDAAGNEGDGTHVTVALLPVVGSVTPTSLTMGTATTLSTTYVDDNGVTSCTLYVGGSSQGTMSLTTSTSGTASKSYTPSSTGTLSAYVSCRDNYGNTGTGSATSITVSSAADTTAPTVGTISPTTATAGTATTFSASYSDSVGVTGCTLYIGGVSQGAMTLSGSTSGTATKSYTFSSATTSNAKATCVDAAANSTSGSVVSVTVSASSSSSSTADTTAPTVGSVTPTTAIQNTAVTFSVVATDAIGIHACNLYVASSNQGAMTAGSSNTYTRSYTPSASGTLSVYASCDDAAGNTTSGASTTVTVSAATSSSTTDTTAPTVGAISPSTATAGTAVSLSATVSDSGGVASCTLYVNGTSIGTMTPNGVSTSYSYTFSNSGTATAYAYCVDLAGNKTTGASTTITISAASSSSSSSSSSTSTTAVSTAASDTLIKLQCSEGAEVNDPCRAVYYYDGTDRHAFPNEAVFFTWYTNFDDVIIVTSSFLASVHLGTNVTYHPGSTMAKFITVNTVYAVGLTGELRAINSEATAESIYGTDWNKQVDDISDVFFSNYRFGDEITSSTDFDPDAVKEAISRIDQIL